MLSQDEKKYGLKRFDVISQLTNINSSFAFAFCLGNVWKYLTRYTSIADKSNNENDIEKCHNYIDRAIVINPFYSSFCGRIREEIQEKDYHKAIDTIQFLL